MLAAEVMVLEEAVEVVMLKVVAVTRASTLPVERISGIWAPTLAVEVMALKEAT
jgi:hypothetical protein